MKVKQAAVATVLGMVSFFGVSEVAHADSIYTVKPGDTLSGILMQTKKSLNSMNQVAADNDIADVNLIYAGQKLVFKDDGQVAVASQSQVQNNPEVNTVQQAVADSQEQTSSQNNQSAQTVQATRSPYYKTAPATPSNSDAAARDWIAVRESGGSYSAANGNYIGKYQLSASYLNGDYSPANQERVANNYVVSRYGSWTAAQQFWQSHGWY